MVQIRRAFVAVAAEPIRPHRVLRIGGTTVG
jgi:hypothetical protein